MTELVIKPRKWDAKPNLQNDSFNKICFQEIEINLQDSSDGKISPQQKILETPGNSKGLKF